MRRVQLDEYMRNLKPRAAKVHMVSSARWGRPLPRCRPRNPTEESILTYLDCRRWQKALAEGQLVKLGFRRYRLNV
ncbi:MAG: hypothetical protein KGZ75_08705 [Syntrophomonadaceae bacterium]|jgi:hypothetical protein|nr:hypothetical protein [Syntrophomonadaceae bacterium]